MEKVVYLTTSDNPWNPSTNWDEWFAYDIQKGYLTCQRLARLANTSDLLPQSYNLKAIEEAMNKLIEFGTVSNTGEKVEYRKIYSTVD